jgi:3-oxoacyl-[acyl-carrier protein] reductase
MTTTEWDSSISINLTGTFKMCRAVVPMMKKQHYWRIINVSSTAGQRGEAKYSHYASSKGGIIAFKKSIGVELIRSGIWFNSVARGWVETDMMTRVFNNPRSRKEIAASIPRKKIASPDEIAGQIVFLASEMPNNIIGEILNINGGSVFSG